MNNLTKTLYLSLLMGSTLLFANEQISVDQQIAAIQQATPQERVKLMNQFKQQLATMNAQERAKSISELREKMQSHSDHAADTHNTRTHTDAQRDQMQQNEKMHRMEQMQERHGGDQYMHEMENGMNDMEHNMDDNLPYKLNQH